MAYSTQLSAFCTVLFVSACASAPGSSAPSASRVVHRFASPPQRAAECFAHNAEEHSSALVAEVRRSGRAYEVAVRVKNGVPYATAIIDEAGAGSRGTITLNVRTTGSRDDLVEALTEGC